MNILKAGFNDAPELVALINSAYRGESSKKGWTTEADLLDGLRTDQKNMEALLSDANGEILKCLNDEGKIIGCVNLQKHDSKIYLGMLTVSPELQGAGVGKQLLAVATEYAKDNNCVAVYMTVISARHELIAWYERHGYKRTGEKKPFPADTLFGMQKKPLEFIVLEKSI